MTENWAQNEVLTPHFCRCKLCVPCLLRWVRTRAFGGLGPKTSMTEKKEKRGADQFLYLVSLCNNFADRKRSNVSYNCKLPNLVASPLLPDP